MEIKTLPFAAKVDAAAGTVSGLASAFGKLDSYGDQVAPGAYLGTIPDFLTDGFMAWNHDWSNLVATPKSAEETADGLMITCEFHSHDAAQTARVITQERLDRGLSMGLSIGYKAEKFSYIDDERGRIRLLEEVKLYEVSLVSVPADSFARVTDAKSLRYPDHGDRVLADVRDFIERSVDISDLRAKAGRVLSDANRRRLAELRDQLHDLSDVQAEIEDLLASTEPKGGPAVHAATEMLRLRTDSERLFSRVRALQGVS